MLELDKEIAEKYSLDIKNIMPYKDAFVINTSKGKKILKKSVLSPDRIMFVHGAKEHLYNNNFKNLDRYLCTVDGKPFISLDSENFTVSDIIEGTECNFDIREDVACASRLLANLHKASKGYIPPENSKSRDDLGKLPYFFGKRLDEIKKLKKIAKKGRSKFDYLFLEYFDYFFNLGENAIELLNGSNYNKLVEETKKEGIFCHHDYTHHNIICNGDKVAVINFDFSCFELKVYDLANLLRRKMRRCYWDVGEARMMVQEYRSVESVSEEELFIMKIILQFPQKLWRVVNRYYNSKRSWSEKSYIAKLQEVVDEIEYHKNFIDRYEMIIK